MNYPPVQVCVWGEYACFTRPEMKVERVSYEVMTPSAARGILEAIFWKPEFRWLIREIRVFKPIRYFSMLRNEVNSRATVATARRRDEGGYYAEEDRSQRHTLCLRDVAYNIIADVAVRPGVQEDQAKYRDQFQRRVKRGQCHTVPYLGCREFSAYFGSEFPEGMRTQPQNITTQLGQMLFDLDYLQDGSGRGQPRFFAAELQRGVMRIPEMLYREEK